MKHNEVASLALRDKRLGLKLRYRPEEFRAGGEIRFHLPLSRLWSFSRSSRKGELGTIRQRAPDGTLLRSLSLHRYSPNVTYTLGDKGFSGDNIKGLAMIGVRDVKSVVIDVKKERKLSKGKLGRGIRSAQRFEIGGLTQGGDYLTYRCFYFAGKRGWRYQLMVLELGDLKERDPDLKFVLDSFKIIKAK